jgi:hypothetical protein
VESDRTTCEARFHSPTSAFLISGIPRLRLRCPVRLGARKALELFRRWKSGPDRGGEELRRGDGGFDDPHGEPDGAGEAAERLAAKVQGAEPVAALYAQGKVRHVGHFCGTGAEVLPVCDRWLRGTLTGSADAGSGPLPN